LEAVQAQAQDRASDGVEPQGWGSDWEEELPLEEEEHVKNLTYIK
jgi:hypothetical protein